MLPHRSLVNAAKTQAEKEAPVIVLVDDEGTFADIMGTLLEQGLGVKTLVFHSPVAALDALEETHPAVVISDYKMPRIDGFSFLRELSRRHPGIPALMLTGNLLDDATIAANRTPSLLGVLLKPLSWREIAGVLRQHALVP
jgi:CheY-like chemotaxis protein